MKGHLRARMGALSAALGLVLVGLAVYGPSASAAVNNLSTWTKQGATAAGTWTVAADGNSVTQTLDGAPTFFVSPFVKETATFTVDITPAQSADSDYVGVVMGYTAPINDTACGNANCNNSYILLDWKQEAEAGEEAGFTLMRVNGSFNVRDAQGQLPCFGDHTDSASCDILGQSLGETQGWTEAAKNTLRFTYGPGQVKVERVGSLATTTIFDVAGIFPTGRIGLYNYSQANVIYAVNDLAEPGSSTTTSSTTSTTLATTSTSLRATTTTAALPATIVRTGPNDRAAAVQLTLGALLVVFGAVLTAARGKRPLGRHFS